MKPVKPDPSDCCGSGCSPCVFDVYEAELKKWEKKIGQGGCCEEGGTSLRRDLLSKLKYSPFKVVRKEIITTDVFLYSFQPVIQPCNQSNGGKSGICATDCDIVPGFLDYKPSQHFIMRLPHSKMSETPVCAIDIEASSTGKFLGQNPNHSPPTTRPNRKSLDEDNGVKSSNQPSFISRAYTPISLSSEERNCCFQMIIKHYTNGEMSSHLQDLRAGNVVYFRGPYGGFEHCPNSYSSLTLICAGTGIAPMISIIKSIIMNENDETLVLLLFTVACFQNIFLRLQIQNFCRSWNVTAKIYLTNERNWNEVQQLFRHDEIIINQRITKDIIASEVLSRKNSQNLICGPKRFCEEVQSWLLDSGSEAVKQRVFVF